jgi:hypothetical protein
MRCAGDDAEGGGVADGELGADPHAAQIKPTATRTETRYVMDRIYNDEPLFSSDASSSTDSR